jgi:predicted RNase H-like HicB family nuclease
MMTSMVVVRAKYDDDAKVWYVEHSDLFGVHAEGTTFDELCGKLPNVVTAAA